MLSRPRLLRRRRALVRSADGRHDPGALLGRSVAYVFVRVDGRGVVTDVTRSECARDALDVLAVGGSAFELLGSDSDVAEQFRRCLGGARVHGTAELAGRVWDVHMDPITDARDRVCGAAAALVDVTAHRDAEARALAAQERNLVVADRLDQGVLAITADDRILYGNPSVERVLGPAAVIPGSAVGDVLPEALRACLRDDAPTAGSVSVVGHDGLPRSLRLQVVRTQRADKAGPTRLLLVSDETDALAAEEERRRDELRLRAMHDALPDLLLFVRSDGIIVDTSSPPSWGLDPGDLVGRPLASLPVADAGRLERVFTDTVAHGGVHTVELTGGDEDPKRRAFEARLQRVDAAHALVVMRDVTERMLAERRLRESEERYRSIVETATEGIALLDLDDRIVFANERCAELVGTSVANMVGRRVEEFVVPGHRERIPRHARLPGDQMGFEIDLRHESGRVVTVWASSTPLRGDDGEVTGTLAMVADVTDYKRTEDALRASEARMRAILEAVPDAISISDRHGVIRELALGRGAVRAGVDGSMFVGRSFADLFPPDEARRQLEVQHAALATGQAETEFQLELPDGEARWFDSLGAKLDDDHVLWVSRDITDRKHAEQALAESEARLRAIHDALPDTIAIVDRDGVIIDMKLPPGYEGVLDAAAFVGTNLADWNPPDETDRLRELLRRVVDDGASVVHEYTSDASGEQRWFEARAVPLGEDRTVTIVRDVTDRRQAEEELRESQRHLQAIYDALPDMVTVFDRDGIMLEASPGGDPEMGRRTSALVGKSLAEIFPPDIAAQRLAMVHEVLDRGEGLFEYENGERVLESLCVRLDDRRVLAVNRDITPRRLAEDELRSSRARLQAIYDAFPDVIMVMDREGRMVDARGGAGVRGVKIESSVGLTLDQLHSPEVAAQRKRMLAEVFEKGIVAAEVGADWGLGPITVEAHVVRLDDEHVLAVLYDVTARKLAEDELRASRARLQAIYDAFPDVIVVLDRAGRVVDVTGGIRAAPGDVEARLGRPFEEFVPPDQVAPRRRLLEEAFAKGSAIGEIEGDWGFGPIWVEAHAARLDDEHVLAVLYDVTARRLAEDEMRASQRHLQAIYDALPDVVWVIGRDGRYLDLQVGDNVSERAAAYLSTLVGRTITEALHPDVAALRMASLAALFAGEGRVAEYKGDWGEGPIWIESRGILIDDQRALVLQRDITARKRAEEELRASEERYRNLVDTASEGIMLLDADFRIEFLNTRAEQLLGYEPGELVGRPLATVLPPHEQDLISSRIARRRAGVAERYEATIVRKDGGEVPVLVSTRPRFDHAGEFVGVYSMVSDLTDLRLADDRLRSLVANLNDAIIIVGDDERVVWASPSIFGVSGATADAVVGQQLFDTVHPEDVAELRDAWEVARRNPGVPSEEFETRGRRADGSLAWYRGTFYDMRHDPAIAGTVVTFRNVTAAHEAAQARRELLRRLDVAEEAERRRLAEDLHDGPVQELAALALRLGTLRLGLTDDTERARRVGEIEARVRESVRKLRTLMFDLHPPELAEHGLAASLRSCAAMVFGEMHDGVRVRDRLAHEPPERVSLTAYRIAREALVNARRHANATRVDVELDATESCLRVSVTDDGKGLPGEVLAHGAPGHFGLRTMCERAEAAGGSLRVENVRGGGARVSVSLPLAEPAAS